MKQWALPSLFSVPPPPSPPPPPPVPEGPLRARFLPSVTVKEGYLHKHKAEGPQLLSRFAFKKRYFWLTSETLAYAKTPDWQVGARRGAR